jgi:hypothetical protein
LDIYRHNQAGYSQFTPKFSFGVSNPLHIGGMGFFLLLAVVRARRSPPRKIPFTGSKTLYSAIARCGKGARTEGCPLCVSADVDHIANAQRTRLEPQARD